MNRFANQVCLVTGGSTGIGLGISSRMAQEGGIVHICSFNKDEVENAVRDMKSKGYDVHGHVCDVAKPSDRAAMIKKISEMHDGRLDVLVPNAGI